MDNESTAVYESHPSVIPYTIVGVIVGGLIGVFVGMNINSSDNTEVVSTNNNSSADYQAGFEAARARLQERGMLPVLDLANSDITYLNGEVKAVTANTLTVEVIPLDPLGDIVDRSVTITPSTELYRLVNKDPAVFQAEMEAFNTKMQGDDMATINTTEFPQPFTKEKITISDIKPDDVVNINTTNPVTATGEIEAVSVQVQTVQEFTPDLENPSLPTLPPPTAN